MAYEFNIEDYLGVLLIAVAGTVISEGISWILFYRTEEFKALSASFELQSKKLEKEKEKSTLVSSRLDKKGKEKESLSLTGESPKDQGQKVEALDKQLKSISQQISRLQFRSTMATSVVMISLFWYLNSRLGGRIVAKLPFEPISLFQAVTHRALTGDDYTDGSAMFLYILLSMFLRQCTQKILGFKAPKIDTASAFGFPSSS